MKPKKMDKERNQKPQEERQEKTTGLGQPLLKENPFTVPEGYFETFSGRLKERLDEMEASQVPVRRILPGMWLRAAIAAAVLGAALISYTLIRFTSGNNSDSDYYSDMLLMEQLDIIDDDGYLIEFLEEETVDMDDEEAYVNQAIEYLAYNDVEMDLIFE